MDRDLENVCYSVFFSGKSGLFSQAVRRREREANHNLEREELQGRKQAGTHRYTIFPTERSQVFWADFGML
jgi:hypothetical protein